MPSINLNPMNRIPMMGSAQARPVSSMPGMAEVKRHEVPRSVPSPSEAIAPAPEAVADNEIAPSETQDVNLRDSYEYENDLTEEQLREFVAPLREKLQGKTWSANLAAQVLGVTHTRLTRKFPKGTKLSEILADRPSKRTIHMDKVLARMSDTQKRELIEQLKKQLLGGEL